MYAHVAFYHTLGTECHTSCAARGGPGRVSYTVRELLGLCLLLCVCVCVCSMFDPPPPSKTIRRWKSNSSRSRGRCRCESCTRPRCDGEEEPFGKASICHGSCHGPTLPPSSPSPISQFSPLILWSFLSAGGRRGGSSPIPSHVLHSADDLLLLGRRH